MPTLVGFGTFAALREEQISEKVSRRILSGDQGMIVWWSIGAGVHVEPHSHANEQIVWMLKGKMEFRLGSEQRLCDQGDVSGRYGARGVVPRRHRGDRFLCASTRRLPTRRQTCLHHRRLNTSAQQPRGNPAEPDGENPWSMKKTQCGRLRSCRGWKSKSFTAGRRAVTPNRSQSTYKPCPRSGHSAGCLRQQIRLRFGLKLPRWRGYPGSGPHAR